MVVLAQYILFVQPWAADLVGADVGKTAADDYCRLKLEPKGKPNTGKINRCSFVLVLYA